MTPLFILLPLGLWSFTCLWRREYRPFIKRFNHGLIFSCFTLLGLVAGGDNLSVTNLPLVVAPFLLFSFTYVINAFYDQIEDRLNGRWLGLPKWHLPFHYVLVLLLLIVIPRPELIIAFCLTELYHNPNVRFKQYWLFQNMAEGLAAGLMFSMGGGPLLWAVVLGFLFAILSNIKDVEDEAGDRFAGNYTVFAILAERLGIWEARRLFTSVWVFSLVILEVAIGIFILTRETPRFSLMIPVFMITIVIFLYHKYFFRFGPEAQIWGSNAVLLSIALPQLTGAVL